MKLVIRGHPVRRMAQRNVTKGDIENALRNYRSSWPTTSNSIEYRGPGVDGRELKVWLLPPGYIDEDSTMTVKSIAWAGEEDR